MRARMARAELRAELDALLGRHSAPADAAEPLWILLDRLAPSDAPTSVHDPEAGLRVHIADSLAGLAVDEVREASVIADLGAGAGLPGLVLAATLPRARVFLIESARRKCEFLRTTADAMGITNTEVIWARAEEWRDGLQRCDLVCARALAALPVLYEYAAPLLREAGVVVAWKGEVDDEEATDGAAAAAHLGLTVDPVRAVSPFSGSLRRTLYVARKVAPTPPGFPRRPGMATKRPLTAKTLR
jgi:16S rRNA (guanine527-N7)-methyltransferase